MPKALDGYAEKHTRKSKTMAKQKSGRTSTSFTRVEGDALGAAQAKEAGAKV